MDTRRCSFGEPYFGEQQGRSTRPWTLSRDVEICRVRADAREDTAVAGEWRGDQALECSPWGTLGADPKPSVWSPTLAHCVAVCVERVAMPAAICRRGGRTDGSGKRGGQRDKRGESGNLDEQNNQLGKLIKGMIQDRSTILSLTD